MNNAKNSSLAGRIGDRTRRGGRGGRNLNGRGRLGNREITNRYER